MALRKGWIFGYLSLFSNGHISIYYTQGTQLSLLGGRVGGRLMIGLSSIYVAWFFFFACFF